MKIIPIILCGGSGTRLWPLSRELYPKQFLKLIGDQTLLQATMTRVLSLKNKFSCTQEYIVETPVIICNEAHRFLLAEQLREIDQSAIILLEPFAKNTAPALTSAALYLQTKQTDDALLLVLPADHLINNEAEFIDSMTHALQAANESSLVTLGIEPTYAATGYGYIQVEASTKPTHTVAKFVEKPPLKDAQLYLDSDHYYWNSGMFVFQCGVYLNTLADLNPLMMQQCQQALIARREEHDFIWLDSAAFAACPSDSIDYAVMEPASKNKNIEIKMITLNADWSDIGTWSALWKQSEQDEHQNVVQGNVLYQDAANNLLHCEQGTLVAAGINDLIVIKTKDAVLVANKQCDNSIKLLVQQLKQANSETVKHHSKVLRPWGSYECMDAGARFQVKRISVKPQAQLSLQMHYHRAEHWVVVKGTAKVTRGKESFMLSENESTYIPIGMEHRLENPGNIVLEIIEIQTGTYLGEDDIVRLDDVYGRVATETVNTTK